MGEDDHQRAAVTEGKKSVSEAADKPLVGVVIVKDGEELGRSYRGRTGPGEHAEYGLLRELRDVDVDVSGAKVYTTLAEIDDPTAQDSFEGHFRAPEPRGHWHPHRHRRQPPGQDRER